MRANGGKDSPLRRRCRTISGAVAALTLLALPSGASAATCPVDTASSYAGTITGTAGLVSYWRLGESSGKTACDSFGAKAGAYQGGYLLGRVSDLAGDPDTPVSLA